MSALAPMVVAAIIVLVAALCRHHGKIGGFILALIWKIDSWTMEIVDDIRRPARRRGDGRWEVLTMRSRVYLAAIGVWFVVSALVGLVGSALFGLFGGMLFAFFPGSLLGALAYRRMIR